MVITDVVFFILVLYLLVIKIIYSSFLLYVFKKLSEELRSRTEMEFLNPAVQFKINEVKLQQESRSPGTCPFLTSSVLLLASLNWKGRACLP